MDQQVGIGKGQNIDSWKLPQSSISSIYLYFTHWETWKPSANLRSLAWWCIVEATSKCIHMHRLKLVCHGFFADPVDFWWRGNTQRWWLCQLGRTAWLFIRNRTEAAAKLSWSVKTLQVLTAFRWIQAQFRLEELQTHSSTAKFVGWGWGKVHFALVCFKRLISRVEKRYNKSPLKEVLYKWPYMTHSTSLFLPLTWFPSVSLRHCSSQLNISIYRQRLLYKEQVLKGPEVQTFCPGSQKAFQMFWFLMMIRFKYLMLVDICCSWVFFW